MNETASGGKEPTEMTTYVFTCPDCGQEIEVNGSMREAILSSGCPVCTEAVEASDFEAE